MTCRRAKPIVAGLVLALLGSNLWWAYRSVDDGLRCADQRRAHEQSEQALTQALAALPTAARAGTPTEVVRAARGAIDAEAPFEKDGLVWVGQLGFRFGKDGRVTQAVRAWSTGE